jgi:hypothetical protein
MTDGGESKAKESLSEQFNRYNAVRVWDSVLRVDSTLQSFHYDFVLRIMYGYDCVTPFSQLDRDVLIGARDKLIALGGYTSWQEVPEALRAKSPLLKRPRGFNL